MLRVDRLNLHILKEVSFVLPEHTDLTILGNNGSGKTTLAKALCHLLPGSGITIDGREIGSYRGNERASLINFVPAKLHVYDEYLTVRDYLELNLAGSASPIRCEDVLKSVGLEGFMDKRCQSLSSGESALLMIAGGLLHNARYTILDEPTANLDQIKKITLFRLLKDETFFQNKIVITHDLNLAHKLGYDILFLENGTLRYHGSCGDFFAPDQMEALFGTAIKAVDDHFVVNYDEVR